MKSLFYSSFGQILVQELILDLKRIFEGKKVFSEAFQMMGFFDMHRQIVSLV